MNPEVINKVSEIVKNVNLVFDGKLNSETLVQVTDSVTQYLIFTQVKGAIVSVIWAIAVVFSAKLVGSAIIKAGK